MQSQTKSSRTVLGTHHLFPRLSFDFRRCLVYRGTRRRTRGKTLRPFFYSFNKTHRGSYRVLESVPLPDTLSTPPSSGPYLHSPAPSVLLFFNGPTEFRLGGEFNFPSVPTRPSLHPKKCSVLVCSCFSWVPGMGRYPGPGVSRPIYHVVC